jgi:ribonuclease-3
LLARAGFDNGLEAYIETNPSQGEFISDRVMATTVEAIIGAVYIDSKQDTAAVERTMAAFGLS